MLRESLLYLSNSPAARSLVTEASFGRQMAKRFVAGETLEEAIAASRILNRDGLLVSLDFLGEIVTDRDEALSATEMVIRSIERIPISGINGNISLKPSQLGLEIGQRFAIENLRRILQRARDLGDGEGEIFVRLDMEASSYTERTIRLVETLWSEGYRNVGTVLQSYLRRTRDDIQRMNELGARVRLVKGAYMEPPSVAYESKGEVDRMFVRDMELLLRDGSYPAIATHDDKMIAATRRFAFERGIPKSSFEFQMLYGIRRDLQQRLREEGYNVRIYLPYGDSWYPYLMRRMAERPANLFFIANSVARELPLKRVHPLGVGAGVIAGALAASAWLGREGR